MEKRITEMEERLETLAADISELHETSATQYRHIIETQTRNTEAIESLAASTGGLVMAWNKANIVAAFLGWMGGIAIMAAALYEIITGKTWH